MLLPLEKEQSAVNPLGTQAWMLPQVIRDTCAMFGRWPSRPRKASGGRRSYGAATSLERDASEAWGKSATVRNPQFPLEDSGLLDVRAATRYRLQ
jgi:hypothetical protein